VSDITGLSRQWTNEGELRNTGASVNVNAVLVNTKDFKWNLGFSVAHYKNELTKLPLTENNVIRTFALDEKAQKIASSEKVLSGYTSSIYGKDNILTAVGEAAGVFYGYKTAGVFSTTAEAKAAGLKYPTGLSSQPSRDFKAGDVHFVDQNLELFDDEKMQMLFRNSNAGRKSPHTIIRQESKSKYKRPMRPGED